MDFFYIFNKQKCLKSLAVANYLLMESNYNQLLILESIRAWKYGNQQLLKNTNKI